MDVRQNRLQGHWRFAVVAGNGCQFSNSISVEAPQTRRHAIRRVRIGRRARYASLTNAPVDKPSPLPPSVTKGARASVRDQALTMLELRYGFPVSQPRDLGPSGQMRAQRNISNQ